jgi:NAD(P)-dependent dehydrogenase (short-subunit alcohol dehydrogenase family)
MSQLLDGRIVVVTGAARGLGRAYALDLAANGATVVANGRPNSPHDVQDVVDEIRANGGKAIPVYESVSTPQGGAAIVERTVEEFGRVDGLINNAGNLRPGWFGDVSESDRADSMDVHVWGAFNVAQPAYRVMREQGYGRIVNTSSNTVFGAPALTLYSAAKAALLGLTLNLAYEGAPHGVAANAVLPVAITDLLPENPVPGLADDARIIEHMSALAPRLAPSTVAPIVTYLAAPACHVSGEAFSAIAGRFARVFFGVTRGWAAPAADGVTTADAVAQNLAQIRDSSTHSTVDSTYAEYDALRSSETMPLRDTQDEMS